MSDRPPVSDLVFAIGMLVVALGIVAFIGGVLYSLPAR